MRAYEIPCRCENHARLQSLHDFLNEVEQHVETRGVTLRGEYGEQAWRETVHHFVMYKRVKPQRPISDEIAEWLIEGRYDRCLAALLTSDADLLDREAYGEAITQLVAEEEERRSTARERTFAI